MASIHSIVLLLLGVVILTTPVFANNFKPPTQKLYGESPPVMQISEPPYQKPLINEPLQYKKHDMRPNPGQFTPPIWAKSKFTCNATEPHL